MVPVFSRRAWRCAWTLIQNDLTHGWGLDLTWRECAADRGKNRTAVQNMGIVDAQGVVHLGAPTLGEQGEPTVSSTGFEQVQRRRAAEWDLFNARWRASDVERDFEFDRAFEDDARRSVSDAVARIARVAFEG
jgi:hypothetical protein